MLVLLFHLGEAAYAMKCDRIREVAPFVALKEVPHAPEYLAGLFLYRGMLVPVIDLGQLIHGESCRARLSTRIILVHSGGDGAGGIMGFIAEKVTEAVRRPEKALMRTGVQTREAPFLGGILMEGKRMIHLLDLDALVAFLEIPARPLVAQQEI